MADDRARELLLDLGAYDLRWARVAEPHPWAQTTYSKGGPIVFVRDDLTPEQTSGVMLHELAHVSDFATGIILEISEAESERRAEEFARTALAGRAYHEKGVTTMNIADHRRAALTRSP